MSAVKPITLSDSVSSVSGDTYQSKDSTTNSSSANSRKSTPLPIGFIPSYNDILCGRGAECLNHEGNKRFRQLIDDNLELYIHTKTKSEKSIVIREIVKRIRNQSLPSGFVRKDLLTGQYYEVGEFSAREKTSQAFRNALAHKARADSMKPQQLLNTSISPKKSFPNYTKDLNMNVKRPFVSAHKKIMRLQSIVDERNAKRIEQQGQHQQQHQQQKPPSNDTSMENVQIINSFINNVSTSDFANVSTSDFATTDTGVATAEITNSEKIGLDGQIQTLNYDLCLNLQGNIPLQNKFYQCVDMRNVNHQRFITETQPAVPDSSLSGHPTRSYCCGTIDGSLPNNVNQSNSPIINCAEQYIFNSPEINIYDALPIEKSTFDHSKACLLQPIQREERNNTTHANHNIKQHRQFSLDSINYNSSSINCNVNFNERSRSVNGTVKKNPNNSPLFSQDYTSYVSSVPVQDTNQEALANPTSFDHLKILSWNQMIGEGMNEKQIYLDISQDQQHQLPNPMLDHPDQYIYNNSRYGSNFIEGNSASRTAVINERNISSYHIIPEQQNHENCFNNNVFNEWKSDDKHR